MIEQISIPLLIFSLNKSKAINFPNILIPFKKVRQFDELIHTYLEHLAISFKFIQSILNKILNIYYQKENS